MSNLFEEARQRLNGTPSVIPERLRSFSGQIPTLGGGHDAGDSGGGSRGGDKAFSRNGSYPSSELDSTDANQPSSGGSSGSEESESLLMMGSSKHGHVHGHGHHHHHAKRGQTDSEAATNTSAPGSASAASVRDSFTVRLNGSTLNSDAVAGGASMGAEAAERAVSALKLESTASK
ncbi:LAME_0B04918g1_1 [Lachancea meyersii CBS 8951]|uniref:LAME_0B04918g1_1 n=1 Tax=Lachancea meyersii CBS 8951 TaxID=1266667 RepID=A0A1G4IV39_9SACH|nr:LAME_0B04918g1_1 [Lachancea meyersii CBS 8951]